MEKKLFMIVDKDKLNDIYFSTNSYSKVVDFIKGSGNPLKYIVYKLYAVPEVNLNTIGTT